MTVCNPQIASGPLSTLGYQEEICYGNAPTNPAMKICRRRSTSLVLTKDEYSSEEVRGDRMVSDSRHGIRRVGGDIVTEISPGGHSDFYEALLGGVWTKIPDYTLTTIPVATDGRRLTFTTNTNVHTTDGLLAGTIVTFSGTGDAQYDGRNFQFEQIASTKFAIVPLDPNYDHSLTPADITGTMETHPLVEMGNIYRSFIFERAFSDIGSFITYRGCRINSASIELPPTGIATSTFGISGKDADPISNVSFDGVSEIVLTDADLGTIRFYSGTNTIEAGMGDFIAAGIRAGDKVIFDGAGIIHPQNRNPRTVIEATPSILKVAEAVQPGGPYSGYFDVTRVGLPNYAQPEDENVLVAVSGLVSVNRFPVGTITSMSLSIDNQMAGSEVVGSNTVPATLFGNQCMVGGTITVLFDRDGMGENLYNAFDLEEDDVEIFVTLSSPDGKEAVGFSMPRVKINTGSIGDAIAEGLPVSCDFRALKPSESAQTLGNSPSQIVITDTTVVGTVDPVPGLFARQLPAQTSAPVSAPVSASSSGTASASASSSGTASASASSSGTGGTPKPKAKVKATA